jgi:hypothetical protein
MLAAAWHASRMHTLKKVTGTWRGSYSYDPSERMANREPVPFTLTLKQGWFGRFAGGVTEDPSRGVPGTGVIEGYFSSPRIEFYKEMPVSYVATPDGRRITFRDFLIEQGHVCEQDIPPRPIFYQGEFSDSHHAQGTWIIEAGPLPLGDGRGLKMTETKGTWNIEYDAA